MKRAKLVRARYLVPMTESNGKLIRIEDGYVLFNDMIISSGPYTKENITQILADYSDDLEIIGSEEGSTISYDDIPQLNSVILPGFVKTHGHDHESVLIGVARDVPLTEWLDKAVNPFTEFLHRDEEELTTKLGKSPYLIAFTKARADDVQFGITTALTHHCNFCKYHVDELAEANDIVGTRIFIGIGSQDRNYYEKLLDSVEDAIGRLDRAHARHKDNPRVTIIPGPDQLFSNGPELLQALKKWAKDHNTLIHIHSSEEPNTTKWFKQNYGQSPVEYAQSINFLDNMTMLAHQVNTTEDDIDIISKHNSIVVHNSLANTVLGSGMPPVLELINAGVRVSISTDGSGSADCQNMLGAARLASQYQKAFRKDATVMDAEDVLRRVTKIPAQILGVNAGVIEPGKDADIVLVDLDKPNLNPIRKSTVVENLIWASSGSEISHVFAAGDCLLDDYKFVSIDIKETVDDIQKLANMFEEYLKTAPDISGTGAHR